MIYGMSHLAIISTPDNIAFRYYRRPEYGDRLRRIKIDNFRTGEKQLSSEIGEFYFRVLLLDVERVCDHSRQEHCCDRQDYRYESGDTLDGEDILRSHMAAGAGGRRAREDIGCD
jgi:hypothetical protein